MAKRISNAERQRIIAEFKTGKSCNQIAKKFGRAPNTISRIAADVGHEFAQANAARAREFKAVYDDERRSKLRLMHADAAERLLVEMFSPAKMRKIGGKDNVYTEREIEEPTPQDKRDLSTAIRNLMSIVQEYDRADTERGAGQPGIIRAFLEAQRDANE